MQGQEAAREPSKISNTTLSDDLAAIYLQLGSGGFNINWIVPLCTLVIDKAADEAIWKAVFDLIARTPSTPPQQIDSGYQDTPINHSAASQQGSEQTHALVDRRIFEEIFSCTYRDVGGFFEKYFDKADKADQVDKIFQATMARYVDGKWTDFPNPPGQARVLDWFFRFQSDFFPDQRGVYYTMCNRSLAGSDAKRRLDLLVRKRHQEAPAPAPTPAPTPEHNWRDVWVIGELKEGPFEDKPLLIQLAGYAREVFASQPTRRFVHGFTIRITRMQLWVFDRSGPYSSTEFDIHKQPERFVQVIAGYLMMSDVELGLDTFVEHHKNDQFITVKESSGICERRLQLDPEPIAYQRAVVCRGTVCYRAKSASAESWEYVVKLSWRSDSRPAEGELLKLAQERGVEGVAEIFAHEQITSIANLRSGLHFGKPHKFKIHTCSASSSFTQSQSVHQALNKVISQSVNRLCGLEITQDSSTKKREASGYGRDEAKRSRSNSHRSPGSMQSPSQKRKADDGRDVPKPPRSNSFYNLRGTPSVSQKRKANDDGRDSTKRLRLNSQASIHTKNIISAPVAANNNQTASPYETNTDIFNNRILCYLVISPPGRSIRDFRSIRELLEACRDAIKAHKSLYDKGNILHRDISENNIIITDSPGISHKGMLIDLDLAKERDSMPSGARHRTGTMEFMAIEVLKQKKGFIHTYRHDLESFFYVFLWVCIIHGWSLSGQKLKEVPRLLQKWYGGTYEDIALVKIGQMDKVQIEDLLAWFPPSFKHVKGVARKIRDTLFPYRNGCFTGTFENEDPDIMYGPMIEAFDAAARDCARGGLSGTDS